MSSRKGKCPGCKTPKSNHQFGTPGKHCSGPEVQLDDDNDITATERSGPSTTDPSTSVLLEAIRNLSAQMESLQTQHNDLKKQIQAPQKPSAQPSSLPGDQTDSPTSLEQSRVASNTSQQDKLLQAAAKDVDECASGSAVCEHDALCVNLPGSYACQCKLGYHITDKACRDVNECQENVAECDKRADCYNTDGSYLCVCNKGFYGDGFHCSNSEEAEQCLEGDEECTASSKPRTIKPRIKVKAMSLKKSSAQSLLKPSEWLLMFSAILFDWFLSCM